MAVAEMQKAVRAVGGLLWRERDQAVEVALIHRREYEDWSLPKGTLFPGEQPLLVGYHVVAETTGTQPEVGVRLPSVRYPVLTSAGSAEKVVDYWAMRVGSSAEFTPTAKADALRWVPLDEVDAALTYPRDSEVVRAFAALPRPLRTILLVHHAEPVAAWNGPDAARPLDEVGAATADQLADLLALFAPSQLVTASARRCVQTVEPLAHRLRLPVETDDGLDTASHLSAPEITADHVGDLALEGRGTVVVCPGSSVIPDTLALLADTDGVALPVVHTPVGTVWVLSFSGDALVAADALAPGPLAPGPDVDVRDESTVNLLPE